MKKSIKVLGKKLISLFLAILIIAPSALLSNIITANAAETDGNEITFGKGKILVTQTKSIALKYDDYYSFAESFPGYTIAGIVNKQINSFQVSKGKALSIKDTDVVSKDAGSLNSLVATGVGEAYVYLTRAADSSKASKIINNTYVGDTLEINAVKISVTVSPSILTIMLLAGQSNMEGYCSKSTGTQPQDSVLCDYSQIYSTYAPKKKAASDITGIPELYECNTDNYKAFVAGSLGYNAKDYEGNNLIYPLNSLTSRGKGKTGPDSGLAYEWNRLTGEKVWTVNAAWGGSKIESWTPQEGFCYIRARAVFDAAIQTYKAELVAGHYIKGHCLFFWMQGESDRNTLLQDYQDSFDSMYSDFQRRYEFEKFGIITVRASTGSFLNSEDLYMTAPRISHYYMSNSREYAYSDIYIVSNVNEQWVTDEQINSYFKAEYPEGKFDYPLRSNTTLTALPKTMNEIHGDIHYTQAAHNENGITAAYNMYKIISNETSEDITIKWLGENGSPLDNNTNYSCELHRSTVLVPSILPLYMSKAFTLSADSAFIDYNESFGRIAGNKCGTSVLNAKSLNGSLISSKAIDITKYVSSLDALSISNDIDGVSLNWQGCVNAPNCGYNIYRTTDKSKYGVPIGKIPAKMDNSSIDYTDHTAKSGVYYYYKIIPYCDNTTLSKNAVAEIKYIQYPVLKDAVSTTNGIRITWQTSKGAELYRVYRHNGTSWSKLVDVKGTTYTDTNVEGGNQYNYTVRCFSADGKTATSAYDTNGITATHITAPVLLSATNTNSGVKISWQASKGAELYRIYKHNGSSWVKLADTSETSFTDTDVTGGVQYRYTVRCVSADGTKTASTYDKNGISVNYIATPTIKSATNTDTGIKITWQASNGAELYRVYRRNGTSWSKLADVKGNTYTDTNVEGGNQYNYTVRCFSADGKTATSAYDTNGVKATHITAPVLLSATNTNSGIKISWQASKGAELYGIYKHNGSSWVKLADTSATSFTDTDVTSGVQYRYTVRCVSADGEKAVSTYDKNGISVNYIATPPIKSATNTDTGIKITWQASNGAELYRVYRRNGTSWSKLADVKGTTYTDTNVEGGNQYNYTVRCFSADGKTATSAYDTNGVKATHITAPVLLSATNTNSGVRISWQASKGAELYGIYKHNGRSWVKLADTSATSFTDTDVTGGVQYRYTVRCVSADGEKAVSTYDKNGISVNYIATPTVKSATNTDTGIKITWQASNGAELYRVYRHNGSSWSKLADVKGNTYTDTNVEGGNQYNYTVRCFSADGKTATSAYDTNGVKATHITVPVLLSATNTNSGVKISWQASKGAELYGIYKHNGSSWVKLADTSATSFTDTDVTSGVQYRYTVRCVSADGEKAVSTYDKNGISVNYIATPTIKSATNTNLGIKITWKASDGAELYRVYRHNGTSWSKLADIRGTSYIDTNVTSGVQYRYTVRCFSADSKTATSAYDTNGVKATHITAPVLLSATNTNSGVKISWQASKGAELYGIYKHNGRSWVKLADTSATSFTDTDVTSGVQYRYTVRCVSADGEKAVSTYDKNGISVNYIATPTIKSATNTDTGIKITWQASNGAELYRVYRHNGSSWSKLADVKGNTYTDTNVEGGNQYNYTVRCFSADGKTAASAYDTNGVKATHITAPVLLSATNTDTGIKITWQASKGAELYRVYRHNGTSWSKLADVKGTTYIDTNVEGGNQYNYTVRCISADGKTITSTYDKNGVKSTYIVSPVLLSATNTNLGIKITWKASDGAELYRVYKHNGTSWSKLADIRGTSYIDTNVTNGVQYRYTVRCFSADGKTATSAYDTNGIQTIYVVSRS